jgi:hypothetical protein
MTTSFLNLAETAADIAGVEVYFYPDSENQMPFEDDGCLHVTQDGLRAAFDIGQDCTAAQFNYEAKRILAVLGYPFTSRTSA